MGSSKVDCVGEGRRVGGKGEARERGVCRVGVGEGGGRRKEKWDGRTRVPACVCGAARQRGRRYRKLAAALAHTVTHTYRTTTTTTTAAASSSSGGSSSGSSSNHHQQQQQQPPPAAAVCLEAPCPWQEGYSSKKGCLLMVAGDDGGDYFGPFFLAFLL